MLGTEVVIEMLEVKHPRSSRRGLRALQPPSIAVPPLQALSGLILSPLPITAVSPSLSLPFLPGPGKALSLCVSMQSVGTADNDDEVGHLSPVSWQLEHPPPSSLPDASQPQALPLLAALAVGEGLGFQPCSGATLSLQQWQGERVGNHGHFRTVQGLWCLLVTSDGTSGPEGLHPRALIFPQGGFMWVFGPSVKVTGWADLVQCVSPGPLGLVWPMLCVLGGDTIPASGTALTWPLKSCSVWAHVPAGSSLDLEFCFELHAPVPGIGCTAKVLGFAQKKYPCRCSGEPLVSLPLGNWCYQDKAER